MHRSRTCRIPLRMGPMSGRRALGHFGKPGGTASPIGPVPETPRPGPGPVRPRSRRHDIRKLSPGRIERFVPRPRRTGPRTVGPHRRFRTFGRDAADRTRSTPSTTARPSLRAVPTTVTCWPESSRTSSRATGRCAAIGWNGASGGTRTASPSRWRYRRSSGCRDPARSRSSGSIDSTKPAGRTCRPIRRAGKRSPAVSVGGSTSRTTTRPWMSTSWRASGGCSGASGTRASSTATSRCSPTPGAASTPLSNFEANLDYRDIDDPAITVRLRVLQTHGPVREGDYPDDLDDNALDTSRQPGRRRRRRHPLLGHRR